MQPSFGLQDCKFSFNLHLDVVFNLHLDCRFSFKVHLDVVFFAGWCTYDPAAVNCFQQKEPPCLKMARIL